MEKNVKKNDKKNILWIEDNLGRMNDYLGILTDNGFNVELYKFEFFEGAKEIIRKCKDYDLIILDVILKTDKNEKHNYIEQSKGGNEGGIFLGRYINNEFPELPFIGTSQAYSKEIVDWFEKKGKGFYQKEPAINPRILLQVIRKAIGEKISTKEILSFIIHGHDNESVVNLKDFIQNNLGFHEPIILRDKPSKGRTLIEKFEDYAQDIDLVFVILSPDDFVYNINTTDNIYRQSRPNVLFELGFFYAKLQRRKGKVILLYQDETYLPSDIFGLGYVDISKGIYSGAEKIRKELEDYL